MTVTHLDGIDIDLLHCYRHDATVKTDEDVSEAVCSDQAEEQVEQSSDVADYDFARKGHQLQGANAGIDKLELE